LTKRTKAIFPILSLILIVGGGVLVYLYAKDMRVKNASRTVEACEQARLSIQPDVNPTDDASRRGADDISRSVLADCERKNR
jgi:hypothetical protein